MATLVTLVTTDPDFLESLAHALAKGGGRSGDVNEVSEAEALSLDLGGLGQKLWECMVAFGGLKDAVEALHTIISIFIGLTPDRPEVELEIILPEGKLKLSGAMSPDELAEARDKYVAALGNPSE